MRRFTMIFLSIAVLLAPLGLRGADDEKEEPSFWMKKKLAYSEKILGGLAMEDFEAIGKNAKSMDALGQFEKFVRARTPEYRTQLELFHFANKELIRQAEEKNLDGAMLAYVQLTMSCVNCHKIVRDPKKQ